MGSRNTRTRGGAWHAKRTARRKILVEEHGVLAAIPLNVKGTENDVV
jgi:hypothetical protein